ncbi:MAG TPA: SUMF1/EgtB/PvdO family nonheme iron enzyme, partial [Anaerolineae bacterium]|nr:SUMF1/EgtB/PvdO family nonheme iron enzyme [Anaerolineae bacterium]
LNDGAGTFADSGHPLTAASVHVHGLALGDVDRDGDQDAFLAVASNHANQVWLNDGAGAFVDSGQELPGSLAHGVSLGDLDGDGDLDAITVHGDTRRGSGGRVWLNDGAGLFMASDIQLGDRYSLSVALGDLDGDGDLDAFVAHGDTWQDKGGGQPNAVWLNKTVAAISTRTPISALPGEPYDTQTRPTDGMTMVYVPGGTFLMGSSDTQIETALELCDEYPDDYGKCAQARFEEESPQHAVTLDGFWLDRTEVTNAQYALCVADGACQESRLSDDPTYNGDDHPVAGISWQSASDYCAWAGGRLPTEAEWEYAARGTEGVLFPWGDEFDCAGGNFWDEDTGCGDGYPGPAPVGSFPAGSSWAGALDMAGNAWEWVADAYGPYSTETQVNPTGPATGRERILRGGSWGYPPAFVRAAYRYPVPPSADYLAVGFRCAGSAAPTAATGGPPTPNPPAFSPHQGDSRTRLADEMVMVFVTGGTFPMGSTEAQVEDALARCRDSYIYCNRWFYITEFPQHQVTVDGFWIDQTEVTNAQFRRCVEAGLCQAPAACEGGDPTYDDRSKAEHPVVCVDWHDAQTYCEWAGARLPTEAEWEYAARGQAGTAYPWGNEPGAALQNYCDANCIESWADEAVDDGYAQTSPVGSYPEGASWCGALDMAGNVYEWVGDWLGEYPTEAQTNPTGPATGQDKVARSNSWKSFQDRARTAARNSGEPTKRLSHGGFRCASSMAVP